MEPPSPRGGNKSYVDKCGVFALLSLTLFCYLTQTRSLVLSIPYSPCLSFPDALHLIKLATKCPSVLIIRSARWGWEQRNLLYVGVRMSLWRNAADFATKENVCVVRNVCLLVTHKIIKHKNLQSGVLSCCCATFTLVKSCFSKIIKAAVLILTELLSFSDIYRMLCFDFQL